MKKEYYSDDVKDAELYRTLINRQVKACCEFQIVNPNYFKIKKNKDKHKCCKCPYFWHDDCAIDCTLAGLHRERHEFDLWDFNINKE